VRFEFTQIDQAIGCENPVGDGGLLEMGALAETDSRCSGKISVGNAQTIRYVSQTGYAGCGSGLTRRGRIAITECQIQTRKRLGQCSENVGWGVTARSGPTAGKQIGFDQDVFTGLEMASDIKLLKGRSQARFDHFGIVV